MALSPTVAIAHIITLTHDSSTAVIDPDTQDGVRDWNVGGVDQLEKEWWWLQVNGERFSVDALGAPTIVQSAANNATTSYTNVADNYAVEISYTLTGTGLGSGESLLKESVTIFNLDPSSDLSISLFLYTDLNLGGASPDDSVSLWGRNDSVPPFSTDIGWYEATQSDSVNSHTAILTFQPVLGELGVTNSILDKLNNTLLDLDSDAGLVLPPTVGATGNQEFGPVGPNDVSWAVQYNFLIAANDSDGMGVDKRLVVPEPTTAALCLLGGLALFGTLRRPKNLT